MKKIKLIVWVMTAIMSTPSFADNKLQIILKLDDISVKKNTCRFFPTLDYLKERKIKAGLGVIADRLDETTQPTLAPYLNAMADDGTLLFEVWHHGLDHKRPEFKDTDYSYQKTHFDEAHNIVKDKTGIEMKTFGTPYNNSDTITNRVFFESGGYKVFLFPSITPKNKKGALFLKNRVNMEKATGEPDFDFFVENYNKNKSKFKDYMIIQGHPNNWDTKKIETLGKIIDYLKTENVEFTTPYEYYLSQTKK